MKLLWVSNNPRLNSGYGSQTRQVGPRIAKAGYDIEFLANDGTRGDEDWQGFLVRGSSSNDRYSRDSIREDFARSAADWLVFLYDAWVFTEAGMRDPFGGMPRVAGWVPVDHYPTPMSIHGWLANEHLAIAMSRYGFDRLSETADLMRQQGMTPPRVRYAPHAVDDVFVPTPVAAAYGKPFREVIDVPADAYLVGIVAANNGTKIYDRKGFGDMAHALGVFMDAHADAYVYIHTITSTFDGIDLQMLMNLKGIDPDRLRWADQYALKKHSVTDGAMAGIYSSFDVLLATSRGEGFGLPVIEAQACGVPVIASNWTAQAELVGDTWTNGRAGSLECPSGWLVAVDPDYDPRHGADFAKPRIGSIIGALKAAYARRGDETLRQAAIVKADGYRADAVFDEHWRPILAEMEDEIRPPNREQRRAAAAKARRVA